MKRWLILVVAVALMVGMAPAGAQEATEAPAAAETPVRMIELTGPMADRDAEISGLAWLGDELLFVAENPFVFQEEGDSGKFFALNREDILDYLDSENPEPLEPRPVPILGPDILGAVNGFEIAFDGFEGATFLPAANAFASDLVFLTIEADAINSDGPPMRGYVVWGEVEGDLEAIRLDLDEFVRLPPQTEFDNMSYESLFVHGGAVVALFEANGAGANPEALAVEIDLGSGATSTLPIVPLNYRLTDATTPDADGVFWVVNYFFPGETFLAVEGDPLFMEYGMGASQGEAFGGGYERLVALRYTDARIELAGLPPIQLQMTEDSNGRNWEGIETLDDRGFLIVTDRFPGTLLGFVERPQ